MVDEMLGSIQRRQLPNESQLTLTLPHYSVHQIQGPSHNVTDVLDVENFACSAGLSWISNLAGLARQVPASGWLVPGVILRR